MSRWLGSGREADVYEVDERRVRRRYRSGRDATGEAAVMSYLVERGFPAPAVYRARGAELVLARVDGPTMLAALVDGAVTPAEAAVVLADLHTRLHALPALLSPDPTDRILHLDLHPDNVLLGTTGPVLIDWANASEGPPDLDLAVTALILAEVAAGSFLPAEQVPMTWELLIQFLAAAGGDPASQLDRALARRAANPTLTAVERGRLSTAAGIVRGGGRGDHRR